MKRAEQPSDKVVLLGKRASNPRMEPEMELPNQIPVTSEIPKSSALCNATVKWKSRLSMGQVLSENADGDSMKRDTMASTVDKQKQQFDRNEATNQKQQIDQKEKNPEVVITAVGSQSNLRTNGTRRLTTKETVIQDGDNLSQNSIWNRHSRPGSLHDSRPGSRNGSRPGSRHGSRPSSRNSLASGRVASALISMGTGASFTELPNGGVNADGQAQFSRVNTVDNPLMAAIPYLPVKLAWILCILNIAVPGLGTVLAGISMLCCGSRQGNNKQDDEIGPCCTNIFVGVSQLFTVTFLLIGWIWSITWGVYMVVFAYENKRVEDQEMRLQRVTTAANAFKAGRLI